MYHHLTTHQFCVFYNISTTTSIYTLSLHDALPIYRFVIPEQDIRAVVASVPNVMGCHHIRTRGSADFVFLDLHVWMAAEDRKSTRLNSSHSQISYAVFCLKKKK